MASDSKIALIACFMALAFLVTPAGSIHARKSKPRIPEGFRTCSQNMEITDVRFSAKAAMKIDVQFDDIGCAVIWRNLLCAFDQEEFDVVATARDFNNLSTVRMSRAFYVLSNKIVTPIGFAIAAFSDKKSAMAFIKASNTGKLLSYDELIRLDLKLPVPPVPEDDED